MSSNTSSGHSTPTPSSAPVSRTGRRMALAGSLLAGGIAIGTLFSPIGLAGAQDDSSTLQSSVDDGTSGNAATDVRPDGERGEGHGRRGPGFAGGAAFVQEFLGLTDEEVDAARADGQTLVELAAAKDVSEADLVAALVDEATTRLAEAVEEGRLDADRAAAKTEDLEARITEAVNRELGDGPLGGEGRRGHGGGLGGRLIESDVLAELGLDADVLRTAIEGGATLAEAAAAQGVTEDDLAAALTGAAEERLAEAVANGHIDADEAAEIQAELADRIQDRLDGIRPERSGRGHQPRPGADDDAVAEDGES